MEIAALVVAVVRKAPRKTENASETGRKKCDA